MWMYNQKLVKKFNEELKGKQPANSGKTWKPEELKVIDARMSQGLSLIETANLLKRTLGATLAKAKQLGWFYSEPDRFDSYATGKLLELLEAKEDCQLHLELKRVGVTGINTPSLETLLRTTGVCQSVEFPALVLKLCCLEFPDNLVVVNAKGKKIVYQKPTGDIP